MRDVDILLFIDGDWKHVHGNDTFLIIGPADQPEIIKLNQEAYMALEELKRQKIKKGLIQPSNKTVRLRLDSNNNIIDILGSKPEIKTNISKDKINKYGRHNSTSQKNPQKKGTLRRNKRRKHSGSNKHRSSTEGMQVQGRDSKQSRSED